MTRQKSAVFSVFCGLILAVLSGSAQAGQSVWNHNGSQMLLQSNGNQRVITYLVPRRGISAKRGRVLFRGSRNGQVYSGTAYTFRRGCAPAPYQVSGVLSSEYNIVLRGASPVRSGCRVTGYTHNSGNSALSFTYMRKMAGQGSPAPLDPGFAPPPQQAPQPIDPGFGGAQEGPQVGPVERIVRQIPNGEIIFRVHDQDDPVSGPIRIDVHAECFSGDRVRVHTNYRTCAFDGIGTAPDGITLIMHLRAYGGASCSIPSAPRVQVHDLCH